MAATFPARPFATRVRGLASALRGQVDCQVIGGTNCRACALLSPAVMALRRPETGSVTRDYATASDLAVVSSDEPLSHKSTGAAIYTVL